MAFPTIPTVGAGRVLTAAQADASGTRTFPNLSSLTKNAGDLIIALIYCYQSGGATGAFFSSWGASLTEFMDVGSVGTDGMGGAYKISTGSETGTFTVTQATPANHAAMILMSIPGAHQTQAPVATAIAKGTTAAADPASLSPSWGAEDTLWISFAGNGETGTAGTWTGLTASPTNYSGDVLSALTGDAIGTVGVGVGFRQNNAASEDSGGWSQDLSNTRNAVVTIAVRPAPPVQMPFTVKPQYWRWL